MNTPRSPREILLARHASARPALDAQRAALLARLTASDASPASHPIRISPALSPLAWFAVLGRQLVAPYRRTWAGLACVWATLLGVQQLDHLSETPAVSGLPATRADSALLVLWLEQRRFLAKLDARPTGTLAKTSDDDISSPLEKSLTPPVPHPLGELSPSQLPVAFA